MFTQSLIENPKFNLTIFDPNFSKGKHCRISQTAVLKLTVWRELKLNESSRMLLCEQSLSSYNLGQNG